MIADWFDDSLKRKSVIVVGKEKISVIPERARRFLIHMYMHTALSARDLVSVISDIIRPDSLFSDCLGRMQRQLLDSYRVQNAYGVRSTSVRFTPGHRTGHGLLGA